MDSHCLSILFLLFFFSVFDEYLCFKLVKDLEVSERDMKLLVPFPVLPVMMYSSPDGFTGQYMDVLLMNFPQMSFNFDIQRMCSCPGTFCVVYCILISLAEFPSFKMHAFLCFLVLIAIYLPFWRR